DRRVRAGERAQVALGADVLVPDGDVAGNRALLPAGGVGRVGTVDRERRDWEQIALASHQPGRDALHEVRCDVRHQVQTPEAALALCGNGDGVEVRQRGVDGLVVAGQDGGAPLGVGTVDGGLDRGDRLVARQYPGEREEARLHDGVDARSELGTAGNAV